MNNQSNGSAAEGKISRANKVFYNVKFKEPGKDCTLSNEEIQTRFTEKFFNKDYTWRDNYKSSDADDIIEVKQLKEIDTRFLDNCFHWIKEIAATLNDETLDNRNQQLCISAMARLDIIRFLTKLCHEQISEDLEYRSRYDLP